MRLALDVEEFVGDPTHKRVATILAVSGTTVTLRLGGGEVVADSYLASYSPVVGHVVLVMYDNTSLIVLGRLIGP